MRTSPARGLAPDQRRGERRTEVIVQVGFALALVLLGAVATASYFNVKRLIDHGNEFQRVERLIDSLHAVRFGIAEAETAQRGYIITGLAFYLDAYSAQEALLPSRVAELERQVAGEPAFRTQVTEIATLVRRRLVRARETIEIRRTEGFPPAQARLVEGIGKSMLDAISVRVATIENSADARLAERQGGVERSARATMAVLWTGGVLAAIVLVAALGMLRWEFARRRRADEALSLARAELESRVLHRTADLARANAALAESEGRVQAILENLTEGLIIATLDGRVLHANAAARRMHGVTRDLEPTAKIDDFAGQIELRTLAGEPIALEVWPIRRIARGEVLRDQEVRFRRTRDPAERIYSYSGSLVKGPGGGALAYVAIKDLTERHQAEAALRVSEEKFARAFENNPAAIALTRLADGVVREVNDTWVALTGYSREEILGRSARMIWPSMAAAENFVRELRDHGVVRGWEQEFRKKSGEIFVTQLSTQLLKLEGEELILSTLVDITERKRAEDKLRFNEALLKDMGRVAQVGGWTLDVATGQVFWTEEVAHLHDLPEETQPSKDFGLQFYPPEARKKIAAAVEAAINQGEPYDLEVPFVSATGCPKWVRTIGHPHYRDGQVVQLRGSIQDVTERKHAARRLSTQAAVSRVLAEAGTLNEAATLLLETICRAENWQFGAFWLLDESTQRLRSLVEWQRPGVDTAEILHVTRTLALTRGQGLPGQVWQTHAVAMMPDVAREENFVRREEATRAGLRSALAFPILINNEVVGAIDFLATERHEHDPRLAEMFEMIGRQIGLFLQRRRAEDQVRTLNAELEQRVRARTAELELANKELEAFSYSVSHDLRAPLRAVDGFSRILMEDFGGQLPAGARHCLENVATGARQMGDLIDDLLTFSRLSRLPLMKRPVDMDMLVTGVLVDLESEYAGRTVTVKRHRLPAGVGDQALLRQVWFNLLSNAFKYTRRKDQAEVEIGCRERKGQEVFFVRDNGAGFDMRYADKLFGVFQRLHRADEYEGTGVGLAIVQRIVHRHGGRVWAEAAVDRGATFYFTLTDEAPS